jgi:RTX calcium-binding nonapeptide repeat (4 copies)
MLREGEGAVVRRGRSIAVVVAFLIGCAVFLVADASGVLAEASKKEEARCQGTRTYHNKGLGGGLYTTNDLPGCPKGGLLLGTDKSEGDLTEEPYHPGLLGNAGDDTIRGFGGKDWIEGGSGDDIIYGGPGKDDLLGREGEDVVYGGDGNDTLISYKKGQQGDKLYCGAGKDKYRAGPNDYVDSSCEAVYPTAYASASGSVSASGYTLPPTLEPHPPKSGSPSASPVPVPPSGGSAILLPAAALLLGSGILTYAILWRR